MQRSFHLVAESVCVKNIYVKNSFAYAENDNSSRVRYPTDTASAEFWSQLEASHESSRHWRVVMQQNSLSVDDNIYIYVYVCV